MRILTCDTQLTTYIHVSLTDVLRSSQFRLLRQKTNGLSVPLADSLRLPAFDFDVDSASCRAVKAESTATLPYTGPTLYVPVLRPSGTASRTRVPTLHDGEER
jgi:hypothetical protein